MRLRSKERCPIHGSRTCCGRSLRSGFKAKAARRPIERIEDASNPRGYREIRSKPMMRRLLVDKLQEQKGICGWCEQLINDVREAVPDHIEPRGMGAGSRDDHPDNIRATHNLCNLERGSKRYLTRKEWLRAEKRTSTGRTKGESHV